MPTWRQGMAVGEWRQVAGTALSTAPMAVQTYPSLGNSGPSAKVVAWTGFALDTRDSSIYSAANGGHSDYAGNEVNRIRMTDNAPAWTEPHPSTPPSQVIASTSRYADGHPTSRHTCYGTGVNEVRNRVMILGGSRFGDGSMLGTVDGFNLGSNTWDGPSAYPDAFAELGNTPCPAVVENKSTGDLYVFAQWNVLRWTNSSNTWTRALTSTSTYGQYAASAMDTRRNRMLLVGGSANDHAVYNVATNTIQLVTLTGTNAPSISGDGNAMVYDPQMDAYLVRMPGGGSTVYRINASTFSVDTLPNSGGGQIPTAPNGVWKRFLYVPALKGVIYFPTYTDSAWFIRTM